ncbi:MAG TPA: dethiobiotin synthase [Xanthobacteraceae bacterium]|jgi:dethiobiotin synthetase|nr:dethiobiotin synthase [Xanthobacteraceae bacterium]
MSAVFITATGTDIGKTFVTAGLIRHVGASGGAIGAIKPIVSGFDPQAWQTSDSAVLLAALGRPVALVEVEAISPWRFKAPLSPDLASRREGRDIVFQDVVEFCRKSIAANRGMLLIEGVGGVMVPLDDRRTVLDLMSVLRIPVVLVAGSYVGTISHTLTALEIMARRNLDLAAVVVSESRESAASLEDTVATIARFADAIDLIALPRLAPGNSEHPAFARLAGLIG